MKKKPAIDMIFALGGGKKGPHADDEEDLKDHGDDEEAEGESELDPAFETAWEEYHSHPSAQSFWDAVEACHDAKEGDKKSEY